MAKETIIAKLRGKLDFTEEAQSWLQQQDVWFAREGGQAFFSEMRGSFSRAFAEIRKQKSTATFDNSSYLQISGLTSKYWRRIKGH
jgi:hypothetical protein